MKSRIHNGLWCEICRKSTLAKISLKALYEGHLNEKLISEMCSEQDAGGCEPSFRAGS
ncbi:MAG: hypothetical protein LC098_05485 [Burkholderiales bacterium]|nr:hypothetical protein [Burkholderiales bacterium]